MTDQEIREQMEKAMNEAAREITKKIRPIIESTTTEVFKKYPKEVTDRIGINSQGASARPLHRVMTPPEKMTFFGYVREKLWSSRLKLHERLAFLGTPVIVSFFLNPELTLPIQIGIIGLVWILGYVAMGELNFSRKILEDMGFNEENQEGE